MKNLQIFILLLLVPWLIQAQTQKVSVFSAGGGATQSAGYINFSTIGQPLSVGTLGTNYRNNEGFIFAQQNIITATITANETICYDSPASLLNSEYTGAEGDVTYQWQVWNATSWQDLTGKTSATCNPGNLTETTQYRILVNDKSGIGIAISDTVTVTVYDEFLTGAIETDGETICYEDDPAEIGSDTDAAGGDESISYKWESSTDDFVTDGSLIPGATSASYNPPTGLTETTSYRRYAKDATCNTTFEVSTGTWKVTVQAVPTAFAGNDATITQLQTYSAALATAVYHTGLSWASDGDGSFSSTSSLNPVYTPGDDDIAAGMAELCLTSSPISPCLADTEDCMNLRICRCPSIVLVSPSEKEVLYGNPVTISGTASDSDDNLDFIRVRINGGTWQTASGTITWTIDLDLIPGRNTIEVQAVDQTNLTSGIKEVEVTLSIQVINIPQGWSYISSYLEPTDPNIINMWADIVGANNLMILTGINGMYAPAPFYINTLNNWDVLKGYKVKMNAADDLIVSGDSLTDKTVNFPAGVHLIPVLTNQTTSLDMVFDSPSTDILYMLDIYSNKVYWPGGILYTLTDLVPGRGYLANFRNPVTLSYPPLSNFTLDNATALPPAPGPWACIRTSNFHLISVSTEAISQLQNADYLGAFDSQGNCVGYASLEKSGTNLLLTVYGDEPITAENDGITRGEMIHFRAYNSFENAEKELIATFNTTFPNADGLFAANGLTGISGFKESATGVGENDLAASVLVYPNPATDELNIALTGFRSLQGIGTLITTESKVVKTFTIISSNTQLNVEDLQPGVYVLRIESENQIVIKRVVIQ